MGLFKRINDIITANISEMIEHHEDPEKLMKQAIREMEESIRSAETETVKVLANEKILKKELSNNTAEARRWQTEAERAVDVGDDEKARKALWRQHEHEKIVQALQDQFVSAEQASQTLKHQLDGMNAKLSEAKRNLTTLSARRQAAEVRKKAMNTMASAESLALGDGAFEKFERMKEKVERAEAEAEALAELRGRIDASSESVDDALAAMKARRKTNS
jgi:phage shock protein A